MKKKMLAAVMTAALFAVMMTGCGSSAAQTDAGKCCGGW